MNLKKKRKRTVEKKDGEAEKKQYEKELMYKEKI